MIQSADSGITPEEVCQATLGFVTASDILVVPFRFFNSSQAVSNLCPEQTARDSF